MNKKPWEKVQVEIQNDFVIIGAHQGAEISTMLGAVFIDESPGTFKSKPIHLYDKDNKIDSFAFIPTPDDMNLMLFLIEFDNGDRDVLAISSKKVLDAFLKNRFRNEKLRITTEELNNLKEMISAYRKDKDISRIQKKQPLDIMTPSQKTKYVEAASLVFDPEIEDDAPLSPLSSLSPKALIKRSLPSQNTPPATRQLEMPVEDIVIEERELSASREPIALYPIKIGYKSPSGGFMNYGMFKVSGINPETGKKRTRKSVHAKTKEDAVRLSKLAEPITVEVLKFAPPTEANVEEARRLGIKIPKGATFEDLYFLRKRGKATPSGQNHANVNLAKYADSIGLEFSLFIDQQSLMELCFNNKNLLLKYEFYAYFVYCVLQNESIDNLKDKSKDLRKKFKEFAKMVIEDSTLQKSIDFYGLSANRSMKAFKAAKVVIFGDED